MMKRAYLKRTLAAFAAAVLVLGTVYPAGAAESGSSSESEAAMEAEASAEEETVISTPAPTEEPAEVPTEAPTEAPAEEQASEETAETPAPTEIPTELPSAEAPAEETEDGATEEQKENDGKKLVAVTAKPKKAGKSKIMTFGGVKDITGKEETDKVFTFELYETDSSFDISGINPAEKTTEGTIKAEDGYSFLFADTEFSEKGTYYFVVKEKELTSAEGWTIDAKEYRLTVTVDEVTVGGSFDEESGEIRGQETKLAVTKIAAKSGSGLGSPKAGNLSVAGNEDGGISISGSDVVIDDESLNSAGYQLYLADDKSLLTDPANGKVDVLDPETMQAKTGVTAGASADANSGLVKNGDSYDYTLSTEPLSEGTTYILLTDAEGLYPLAVFTVETEKLTYKNEEGEAAEKLVSSWTIESRDTLFENSYAVSGRVSKTIKITKAISGNPANDETFSFTMASRSNGSNAPVTKTIKGEGTAEFTKNFNRIGTYAYTIRETAGSNSSYTYDKSVYYVTYRATDNGKGGLDVTETITKSGSEVQNVIFTNVYKAATVTTTPAPDVIVTGDLDLFVTDSDDGENVSGSVFTLYGIKASSGSSDYSKAEKNLKKGDVKAAKKASQLKKLADVSSEGGVLSFSDLEAGTYYVVEEKSAASGYQKSKNPIVIKTGASGGALTASVIDSGDGTVETSDGNITWVQHPTKVLIYMRSSTGALLTNARLVLTDNETGEVVDSWKSAGSAHVVSYLVAGKSYTVSQTNRLVGYKQAEAVSFKVEAHDVGTSDYEQAVTIVSERTGTSRGSSSGSGSGSSGRTTTGANTNDASPIIPLVAVMAAAVLVIFFVLRRNKKQ